MASTFAATFWLTTCLDHFGSQVEFSLAEVKAHGPVQYYIHAYEQTKAITILVELCISYKNKSCLMFQMVCR